MNKRFALPMVVAGSVLLAGCFDGSDSTPTTDVRVVHASSDAPAVNVRLNGDVVVSGADFKQAAVLKPDAGSASIAIDGLLPGGGTATVIEADGVSLRSDTNYDVIAVGKVGDDTIEPLILADTGERDSADSVRLRVAHLSPDAQAAAGGAVDVYVTAPGADLAAAEPAVSFEFKGSAGPLEVPAGDYRIRVTPTGTDTIVYDSGTVPLPAGADLLVGAVDNTGVNSDVSPISLIVVNGDTVIELFDANQGAGVRVVHASISAPDVDVLVDDQPTAFDDLTYGDVAPGSGLESFAELASGQTNIKVVDSTTPSTVAINADLDLVNAQGYTVIAVDQLSGGVAALVEPESVRSIATQASLRIIHGSTQAGNVDIYLLPEAQTMIGNSDPALADVPFEAVTDYLAVAEGTYNVVVTTAGTGTPLIQQNGIALSAGGVYTVIARDGKAGATSPLDVPGLIIFGGTPVL